MKSKNKTQFREIIIDTKNKIVSDFVYFYKVFKNKNSQRKFIRLTIDYKIQLLILGLVFLLPIFYLEITESYFELNKLFLIVIFTFFIFSLWIIKIIYNKKVEFISPYIFIPVLFFYLIIFISNYFSIYRENSLMGKTLSEGDSLLTITFFIIIFFVIANFFKKTQRIKLLFRAIALSQPIALFFTCFGINPLQKIENFIAYSGLTLIISILHINQMRKLNKFRKLFWIIIFSSSFFGFYIFNYTSLIILVTAFTGYLIYNNYRKDKKLRKRDYFFLLFLLFNVIFLFASTYIFKALDISYTRNEVIYNIRVAGESLDENKAFGIGFGNYEFIKDYVTIENFRISESLLFNLLSATGLLGLGAFLIIIVIYLRLAFINLAKRKNKLIKNLFAFWIFITLVVLLVNASFVIIFLWWAVTGFALAFSNIDKYKIEFDLKKGSLKDKERYILVFFLAVYFAGLIYLCGIFTRKYMASYNYRLAQEIVNEMQLNESERAFKLIDKAIDLNPDKSSYRLAKANLKTVKADKALKEKPILKDKFRKEISNSYYSSIQDIYSSLSINKYDYKVYERLGYNYHKLIGIYKDSDDFAYENYDDSLKLNPYNWFVLNQMGKINLYYYDEIISEERARNIGFITEIPKEANKQLKLAKSNISKAIEINEDNLAGRIILSSLYELDDDTEKSMELLLESNNLENIKLQFKLAILNYKLERYEEAEKYLNKILNTDYYYSDARYLLTVLQIKQEAYDKSAKNIDILLNNNEESADHLKRIKELIQSGDLELIQELTIDNIEQINQNLEEEIIMEEERDYNINFILGL